MIEVFKTNVDHPIKAKMLIDAIHLRFDGCSANFDLDDCDRILRIASCTNPVHPAAVVALLKVFGFHGEVLPDDETVLR